MKPDVALIVSIARSNALWQGMSYSVELFYCVLTKVLPAAGTTVVFYDHCQYFAFAFSFILTLSFQ
jgi:hypothetical protein